MTKEEIISYITTMFIKEEETSRNWFKLLERVEKEEPNNTERIKVRTDIFLEHSQKADLLHDLLKEITK